MKFSFRSLVKSKLDSQSGIGVELFRLSDADPEELTAEELDAAIEAGDSSGEIAVMRLYDDMGKAACATVEEFAVPLDTLSDVKRIHLHINSRGGEVSAAFGICYMLHQFTPRKIAYIGDVAAGAATIIMCACDEVIAGANSSLVVCQPRYVGYDNAKIHARDLETITNPFVSVYKAQTRGKLAEKEIRQLMANQTWMTGEEALKKGFVTSVSGKISRQKVC